MFVLPTFVPSAIPATLICAPLDNAEVLAPRFASSSILSVSRTSLSCFQPYLSSCYDCQKHPAFKCFPTCRSGQFYTHRPKDVCSRVISCVTPSLSSLNQSICTCPWKNAIIFPIPKRGNPFRPQQLLPRPPYSCDFKIS